jgi:2-amino-4-hydroxy-6-hydroxymethyldihydropteridine diphosphokinase
VSRRLAQGVPAPEPGAPGVASVAVVALGSNLGDRAATLDRAVRDLARLPLVDDVRVSEPVESVAVTLEGPDAAAPAYLNSVALLTTRLAPSVLLSMLHRIEAAHGRERRTRWGDRTLDLDLIAYGDVVSSTAALTLPHPRAAERDFVLEPWLRVDPDAELPGHGRVEDLLRALRDAQDAAAEGSE